MKNAEKLNGEARHLKIREPSPWVRRFAPLVRKGGAVLDVACGGGRHSRLFLDLGHHVAAVDRDISHVAGLKGRIEVIEADLEAEEPVFSGAGPLAGRRFAGVVVCNYLHRPLLPFLLGALEEGGAFIYETFAEGNEHFSRPRNPDHFLKTGELLELTRGRLQVVAYEHGLVDKGPLPGVKQRIAAVHQDQFAKML